MFNGCFITSLLSLSICLMMWKNSMSEKIKLIAKLAFVYCYVFGSYCCCFGGHMTQSSLKTFMLRYSDTPSKQHCYARNNKLARNFSGKEKTFTTSQQFLCAKIQKLAENSNYDAQFFFVFKARIFQSERALNKMSVSFTTCFHKHCEKNKTNTFYTVTLTMHRGEGLAKQSVEKARSY